MLGWSNAVASQKSGIAISTIQRARGGKPIIPANMSVFVSSMENAGIVFGDDGSVRRVCVEENKT